MKLSKLSFFIKVPFWFYIMIVLMITGISVIEYSVGPYFDVVLFFLFPIAICSWTKNLRTCLIISTLTSFAWILPHIIFFYEGYAYETPFLIAWNFFIRFSIFTLVAFLISKIRTIIDKLEIALINIKKLEGLLPICAWCKSIRDENGKWRNLEEYISNHSNANFTHGICQNCLEEYNNDE